jgi:NAD(P)-dependent dehydrogenase (short-subunit alcohol dehydrogenase family)
MLGFDGPIRAVIIGASGSVGNAFVEAIASGPENEVWGSSRTPDALCAACTHKSRVDITDEASIIALADELKRSEYSPNVVLNCTGILHTKDWGPERSWRHFNIDTMRQVFDINTFGVALLAKHLIPLLPRRTRSVFASFSARVGSISDNRLGGWTSYRASKAAQNMVIKGLSIEARMRWPGLICVALHPGTVRSNLSAPFTALVPEEKLFSPAQSCSHLQAVITDLAPTDSGNFYAWDGTPIPY